MPKYCHHYGFFIALFFCTSLSAQTDLYPGDIAVMGIANDIGACGYNPESDQISFVCFRNITTGTTIDVTDNAWEFQGTGSARWGDGEGTIRMTRTGGMIPAGTVITFHCNNTGGTWSYKAISPDVAWGITYINYALGGPLNLEPGGDQLYFMQGGTWSTPGGNKATYDGRILYGFNTLPNWATNSTTHQSNLHPDVDPCYHFESPNVNFFKYTTPFNPSQPLRWLKRIQDPNGWLTYPNCAGYLSGVPNYGNGYSIELEAQPVGTLCAFCDRCPPYDAWLVFNLPDDFEFDVVYTNGIDTFEVFGIENFEYVILTITDTVSYWILSATEVSSGCTLPPVYDGMATYNAPYNDPGLHGELWICEDHGPVPLLPFLNGTPELGGIWYPAIQNDSLYYTVYGEGIFIYQFRHPGTLCPADTASVTVQFVDASETIIEVSCDQNGTPNNIFDDRIALMVTVIGQGFGPTFDIKVSSGSITPTDGLVGVPTLFLLSPGSATGPNLTINIRSLIGFGCDFDFPIVSPGFCSDPCDYSMEAFVSGAFDICNKNCPDDPAIINVDVAGGTLPFKMDFSLYVSGFPIWNFTGVAIDPNDEIEICISNVPAPVYNSNSKLLTLPEFLAGHELTFTLVNVYDKYNCTAILGNPQHYMILHQLPTAGSMTLNLCRPDAINIDLTEFDGIVNPFLDVTWYDENPLTGGDQINSPTGANLENIEELWAHIADDYCENSVRFPFTIFPQPEIDSVPPLQICKGDFVSLQSITLVDQGESMPIYSFHQGLPPDSTNILDPLYYVPVDTTIVYLLATAGMCYDTLPIEIDVQDIPDFSLQATPCDLLQNTYSILFTSSADSIHSSVGTVFNSPAGQDAINGIPFGVSVTIEIINPSGLCKDTFLITAPNCNCPLISQPVATQSSYEICEGSPIPVLSVNGVGGLVVNWYDVPSGGVPLVQNSLTYQPANGISAIYYAEALDVSSGCYSIRTEIPFTVNPDPDLQSLTDPVLCETEQIDFNIFIPGVLNGVSGSGQWRDLATNAPVSGIIQPQNGNSWYYLFTSNPGNCISSDTVSAIVNPLPVVDLFNILCNEAQLTYEVQLTSDADVLLVSTGNLLQTPGTDSFLLSDIPYDTDIQFILQNTTTGCNSSAFQAAPDCSCPPLLQNNTDRLCSDQGIVDLSAFEGLGVSGNWQLVSTPPGSNPATLTGSTFQGQNADPGLYTLRFIRSVILADCEDTASFDLQLQESPFADAGNNSTVCAPDAIQLTGNASGDNIVFNWQENGTGTIGNPNALNTNYTPTLADISSGAVSFTLTVNDQTGFCPSANETITVTIDATSYFIVNAGSQIYCDTSDVSVDFDDLISFGTKGGEWFFPDTVNAPIVGSSVFNPSTLTAGNYTIFYSTANAVPPCKNDTVAVNFIIENCSCPSVALSVPGQGLCSDSGVQDLNEFLLTTEPGTWSIAGTPPGSSPAVLNGSDFVTNNSNKGIYRLRFTLSNPVAGCDDYAEIDLEVIATPSLQITSVECAGDLQSWQVVITTIADDVIITQGTLTSLGNDQYLIEGLTINTSVQLSASNSNGLCTTNLTIPAPDCACTLNISNLPDNAFLCPNEKVTFNATVTGAKGNVTRFWIVASDSLYQNSLEVDAPGIYQFVSIDSLGCREEKLIDVSFYTEMVPDASVVDITCPGDADGQIILHGILGGNGPYFISINGGNMLPVSSFPHEFTGLGAGIYNIDLLDGFNCSITFNLMVSSVSSETLDLGPDKTILVGDSLLIHPLLSFTPDSFYWIGDLSLIHPDLLDNWIKPEEDQFYTLFALDPKGCLYSDELNIRVLLKSSIYIPSIFSPNGDHINDVLIPFTDPSITQINYFEIFSRWGELVYSFPNQSGMGWDGTLAGKKLLPGVFVYRIEAINKKGKVIQQTGDITLLR